MWSRVSCEQRMVEPLVKKKEKISLAKEGKREREREKREETFFFLSFSSLLIRNYLIDNLDNFSSLVRLTLLFLTRVCVCPPLRRQTREKEKKKESKQSFPFVFRTQKIHKSMYWCFHRSHNNNKIWFSSDTTTHKRTMYKIFTSLWSSNTSSSSSSQIDNQIPFESETFVDEDDWVFVAPKTESIDQTTPTSIVNQHFNPIENLLIEHASTNLLFFFSRINIQNFIFFKVWVFTNRLLVEHVNEKYSPITTKSLMMTIKHRWFFK